MIRATLAQATHFILEKNYLTNHKAASPHQLVRDLGGLPGSIPTTPFLSAQARLTQFEPDRLLRALYREHSLIRANLMRNASCIVPTADYASLHSATWRQRNQALNSEFRLWQIDNDEIERLAEMIREIVVDEPVTLAAIIGKLSSAQVRELTQTSRGGRVTTTTNAELALRWLTGHGVLCAGWSTLPQPHEWWTDTVSYAPLNHWYPDVDLATVPAEADAQKALVRTYLAAYGPATEADISFWTGFGKSETARAIGALAAETTLTLVGGFPGTLLLLKDQTETLNATSPPAEPLINILPADDPYTIAYRASRARYVADQTWQRQVFSSSGAAKPTILVNGQIAGVWVWQPETGPAGITWDLLTDLDPALLPLIETEIARVSAFMRLLLLNQ
jgi:DNA glycosylase AlkZ-like